MFVIIVKLRIFHVHIGFKGARAQKIGFKSTLS